MRLTRFSWLLIVPMSLMFNAGCEDSASKDSLTMSEEHGHGHDHGHDHGPATLKDAIAELTTLRDTMRDAFAKNDLDAAHDPLHEVGHVLEAIPELAKKENVSAESQTAIETAASTLMDAFGAVDKTMHGQEGSSYSDESEKIDAAMASLVDASEPAASAPELTIPATDAPATEAPATEAPATEAPATEAPATEAPATEAPATEAPATEAPATEAPATEAPATEAPATEAPAQQ